MDKSGRVGLGVTLALKRGKSQTRMTGWLALLDGKRGVKRKDDRETKSYDAGIFEHATLARTSSRICVTVFAQARDTMVLHRSASSVIPLSVPPGMYDTILNRHLRFLRKVLCIAISASDLTPHHIPIT